MNHNWGLHWTVCGVAVFLMATSVSAVVEPITVTSDVDTVTCAGDIPIPVPRVCPGGSITLTCTTNLTGNLLWRTSTSGSGAIFFTDFTDDVGSMGSVIGGELPGFTATLTAEMGLLLTSNLTTTASDDITVTCLDSIIGGADRESTDILVADSPSQAVSVSATSDSLDCGASMESFTVSWQCPADTGGTAITNFTVSVDGGSPQTFMGTAAMSDPIPVTLNEQHSISVTASNCVGIGPPDSISVNPQAPVPSDPENVQATLNCQDVTLNAITVTWSDPNTNLRCGVTSTTVGVESGDISLSCPDTSSPRVCTGNITEGLAYTATVGFSSSLPVSQSNPSTASDEIIVRRCTVDRTLRPDDCIQVTLDDWCEEDHTRYGVAVLNQDMSESAITRFDPSDTICVPVPTEETFSLRLYFNETFLEQKSGIMAVPESSSSSIGAIVGGVVGGIAALVLAVVVVVLVYLFCCRDKSEESGVKASDKRELRDIALEDNAAYGPVTPQQPAAIYEEVPDQPERIEMSGNVAYGQISH